MKFKVGDIVTRKKGTGGEGKNGVIKSCRFNTSSIEGSEYQILWEGAVNVDESNYQENLILITTNDTTMNLKQKFTNLFLTEPEKSYRKAGITNGYGLITEEGQQIFLTWLLKKFPEFNTEVVSELLKEVKED